MGTYRLERAPHYHLLARRLELESLKPQLTPEEYFRLARQMPQELPIYVRHMTQMPGEWNEEHFGMWPESGILCVYTRFPSSNKALVNRLPF